MGGAVRDKLLKLPVKDEDYLVVGATVEQMLKLGYQQVGRDFPVFLHPKTRQEYALARTERKSSSGHAGFKCFSSPDITLNQDLLRRDLTINAIAQDTAGKLHDPFNGQLDLKHKTLRHISDAFIEDPLRVLRVARFAAKLHKLGFIIAPETMSLMQSISQSNELESLSVERVWQEFDKALATDSPEIFIQVLIQAGALRKIIPSLELIFATPYPTKQQNSTVADYAINLLAVISAQTTNKAIRFAALLSQVTLCSNSKQNNQIAIEHICQQLKPPKAYAELASYAVKLLSIIHDAFNLSAQQIIKLFDTADAWRKPERFEHLLLIANVDYQIKSNINKTVYKQSLYLQECFALANQVSVTDIVDAGFKGKEIKEQLVNKRIKRLTKKISHLSMVNKDN